MRQKILLLSAALLQLSLLLGVIFLEEGAVRAGLTVQVPARSVDPFDPFRGRYVVVDLVLPEVSSDLDPGVLFVEIRKDPENRLTYGSFSKDRPAETNHYLEVTVLETGEGGEARSLRLATGPLKVYLPEQLAPEVEGLVTRWGADTDLVLEGVVFQGNFRPLRFLYKGKEVRLDAPTSR